MDILARLLVRAAIWVRRPPSRHVVIAAAVAVALSLVLVGIERFIGWPDWLTADRLPRRPGLGIR